MTKPEDFPPLPQLPPLVYQGPGWMEKLEARTNRMFPIIVDPDSDGEVTIWATPPYMEGPPPACVMAVTTPAGDWKIMEAVRRIPDRLNPIDDGGLLDCFMPGTPLEFALYEAWMVARARGRQETLKFNGVLIPVLPESDLSELVAAYQTRPCRFMVWDSDTDDRLQLETLQRQAALLFYLAGLTALHSEPSDTVSEFTAAVMRQASENYLQDAKAEIAIIAVRVGTPAG